MWLVVARNRQAYRLRAGGQQKPIVGHVAAPGGDDMARFDINAEDLAIEAQFNAGFAVVTVRTQRHPVLGGTSGKIVLGQVRSIDRCRGITAQHDDAAAKLPPPKHLGRSKSRRAAADDDNSVRRTSQRLAARLPLFKLLMNKDPAVSLLDLPAGKRVYGRRADG